MLKISFTDFWIEFNEKNNLITNILNELFNSEILITKPNKADVCLYDYFLKFLINFLSSSDNF